MKDLLVKLFLHLCLIFFARISAQQTYDCTYGGCPDSIKCDPCGDCTVFCNSAGACKGKTIYCPGDHLCSIYCGSYNGDIPEATEACMGATVYMPTCPKAGAASCLPDGQTYCAPSQIKFGAEAAGQNMTVHDCYDGVCSFFACDTWNPSISSCSDYSGMQCDGSGCPPK